MTIKTLIKNLDKKERLFLIFMAVIVILATTLPYAYGYLKSPKNTYFLAVSGLNKVDYPNYFSYIEQVKQGHFLFEDYYTTEPQPRIIFNLFFLILGLLAKIFHGSAVAVFHIARIILIPVFIFIFYLFTSFLFKEKIKQKICLVLACFSSGLGFVLFPFIKNFSPWQQPMDLWIPEAVTFLTFYTNPLFIFSLILIVSVFFFMLLALENKSYKNPSLRSGTLKFKRFKILWLNYKYAIFAGVSGLVLFQIHPYHFPTIFFVLGMFWLALFFQEKKINWMFFKYGLVFFIITLPSLLYYYWLSSSHWLTIQRINQAIPVGFTPPFIPFLISYGLLWPFVIIGIYFLVKNKKINHFSLFLITWLLAQITLIYLPFPLQRRMSEGLHLVICILAAFGVFVLYQKIKRQEKFIFLKNKFLWIVLFIFLFTCSNIFIVSQDIIFFSHKSVSLRQEIIASMTWLKENSLKNSAVLSSPDLEINNLVPAFAVRKVYAGHGCETAYFARKIKEVDWFFETNDYDQKKQKFLKENNLNYVLIYKEDHLFQPEKKEYLKKVFENNLVGVYRVNL